MALTWDSTKCVPKEPIDVGDAALREVVILSSMMVDIGELTLESLSEWLFRVRVLEELGWSPASLPIPAAGLRRWVGLRMNVVEKSRADWLKQKVEMLEQDIERKTAREMSEVEG